MSGSAKPHGRRASLRPCRRPAPPSPGASCAARASARYVPAMAKRTRALGDEALLDKVQRQTLRYFWDFAEPMSGLARERSNVAFDYGLETVTTGGSGFGVMAIVAGVERGWIPRRDAAKRLVQIL